MNWKRFFFLSFLLNPQDQFDTIDLSDNEIKKVENFPLLTRLKTLFFNNNQISKLASLGEVLPYLDTLILTNNKLTSLSDLDPLATLTSLRTLSLLENPVSLKNNYRLYVIHLLPKLRLLDFKKVKQRVSSIQFTIYYQASLDNCKRTSPN